MIDNWHNYLEIHRMEIEQRNLISEAKKTNDMDRLYEIQELTDDINYRTIEVFRSIRIN